MLPPFYILAHLSVSLRGMVYTCQEESLHIYYIVRPVHLFLQVPVQFIQNTIKTDERRPIWAWPSLFFTTKRDHMKTQTILILYFYIYIFFHVQP